MTLAIVGLGKDSLMISVLADAGPDDDEMTLFADGHGNCHLAPSGVGVDLELVANTSSAGIRMSVKFVSLPVVAFGK